MIESVISFCLYYDVLWPYIYVFINILGLYMHVCEHAHTYIHTGKELVCNFSCEYNTVVVAQNILSCVM